MPPNLTDGLLNFVLNDFTQALIRYEPGLVMYGARIVGLIVFMQFGYLGVKMALGRDFMHMLYAFFTGLLCMGAVLVLMTFVIEVGSDLVMVGQQVGTQVSGMSPSAMTPSGVYNLGLSIIGSLWNARSWGKWFHPIDDAAFVTIVLLTLVTYAMAAIMYLWALIEAVWVVAIAPMAICFAPFEYTWPTMITWGAYALKTGIKLLGMLLVLAVGTVLATGWASYFGGLGASINSYRVYYATVALIEAFIFLLSLWILPNKAAALIHTTSGGGPEVNDAGAAMTMQMGQKAATTMVGGGGGKELGRHIRQRLMS
jgi:hypothetical protein